MSSNPLSRKEFLNRVALGAGSLLAADFLSAEDSAWGQVAETPYRLQAIREIPAGMDRVRGLAYGPGGELAIGGSGGIRLVAPPGTVIREFRPRGAITSLVLDEEGLIYAAHPSQVEVLTKKGDRVRSWGEPGQDPGCYGLLTGIAVSRGILYLADAANRRISRCAVDGDPVDEFEGFQIPSAYFDCGVDGRGHLCVGHTSKHRVEKYDGNWERVSVWGEYGPGPEQFCGCCNPTHLAVFSDGRVATAEKGIPRVKVYNPEGELLAYLGPEDLGLRKDASLMKSPGKGEVGSLPCHNGWPGIPLAVSSEEDLAVAIPGTETVRVYRIV